MQAINVIYQQHASMVYRFALGLCGDAHLAHDLVAETFMRAMLSSAPISMETVQGYLCTIARRLYLKEWQRHQRQAELDDVHCDPGPGPEKMLSDAQEMRATLRALQTLPELDRSALLMRAEEEVPYDDIARALDISLSSAKVKVFRARVKLLTLLKAPS